MIIRSETLKALNTGFKKLFQNGLETVKPQYEKIATVVPSSTASNTYGWLGKMPKLKEWIGERQLENIKDHAYTITNKKFANGVEVDREDIEDDNIGIYSPLFTALGAEAGTHADDLVFGVLKQGTTALCYDGQAFFDADHPVYPSQDQTGTPETVSNFDDGSEPTWYLFDTSKSLKPLIFQSRTQPELVLKTNPDDHAAFTRDVYQYGVRVRRNVGFGFWQMAHASKLPLNAANLNAAIAKMQTRKADGGSPLNITPTLLVVPPQLRAKAKELVNADQVNGTTNVNKDVVEVLSTARVMD